MEFLINNLSVAEYPLRRSATLSLDAVDDLKEYLSRYPETLVFVNAFQDGLGKSYQEEDLGVLSALPEIKRIFFAINFVNDFSGIYFLEDLKELTNLNNENIGLDFSRLSGLEHLSFYWDKKTKGLFGLNGLRFLKIHKYKSSNDNLQEFQTFVNLHSLELVQSSVSKITGLEHLPKLKKLVLAYNSKLEAVSSKLDFQLSQLEHLVIENCKQINLEFIKVCPNLKKLELRNQGKILTLRPILGGLTKLEKLFVGAGTIIEETDNLYYRDFGNIKEFFFQDARGKALTCKDLGKEWTNT